MNKEGKLIWITGLSGSGKTTIAKNLYRILKKNNKNHVHLDGDKLRYVLAQYSSYDKKSRERLAETYARLCKTLTHQGINVIISTISMFHGVHAYNRDNNNNYYEIFLDVDKEILLERNKKNLYGAGSKNVVGIDIKAQYPKNPDIILKNCNKNQLDENLAKIINLISSLEIPN